MTTVAIYGSSRIAPHNPDYVAAYGLGKALAQGGYTVMTGGYSGIMEAACRGANEAGGQAIGVTSETIENYRGGRANSWVTQEIRQKTLRDRLTYLILIPDAYIVMPGGTGTLNELVMVWELVRVGDLPKRPIICYGAYWQDMLTAFRHSPYLAPDAWTILEFVTTPQAAIDILQERLKA